MGEVLRRRRDNGPKATMRRQEGICLDFILYKLLMFLQHESIISMF